MKAAQISKYGSAENISVNEVEKPIPKDNQVLVAVKAASLNPFDIAVREGHISKDGTLAGPLTLGGDIAGLVEAIGLKVTGFRPGDKVFGTALSLSGGSGGLAEFAVANQNRLALAPNSVDFIHAASLPLVGSSAVQALYDHIALKPNEKLFIHGGSGGIGTTAVQVAKHVGAYVAASDRSGHADELIKLGVDQVVNSTKEDFSSIFVDFNAVLNLVRGEDFDKFIAILNPGGVIVSLTGVPDDADNNSKDISVIAQGTDTNSDHLNKVKQLVEQGAIKPVIAETYALSQSRDAFKALEQGGNFGKIVIKVND